MGYSKLFELTFPKILPLLLREHFLMLKFCLRGNHAVNIKSPKTNVKMLKPGKKKRKVLAK